MLCIGSKFTLMVQVYFHFTRECWGLWKWVFTKEKYPEICATLPTPQKASACSVLKTMWSFNSNKHIIFSTIYRLWLFRRKAFYRRCIPRSISIINDTAIVRNLYPKKFHPWCKSKKLSKHLPRTWWEFAYDHF